MTEREWTTSRNPYVLLEELQYHDASLRKFRLFVCGYCRLFFWGKMPPEVREAVETGELWADGSTTRYRLRKAQRVVGVNLLDKHPKARQVAYYSVCASNPEQLAHEVIAMGAVGSHSLRPRRVDYGKIARLIHCVFGNPFRATTEKYRVITPQRLAASIYTDRAFDRLPILADALEEAGCTDEAILSHCRGPGPHVRGCWVVDLLLGKE